MSATKVWFMDDEPSARFPIYCRGNTGEVFPNVATPLGGSLIGLHARIAQEEFFLEMGGMTRKDMGEPGMSALTGFFGGYLYGNMSAARLVAVRTPGMGVADIDQQMFGTSDAPPYRRQPGDRSLLAGLRMGRAAMRYLFRPDFGFLDDDRAETTAWLRSLPDLSTATDAQLLDIAAAAGPRFGHDMQSLLRATIGSGLGAGGLERFVPMALPDEPGAIPRLLSGLGTIETAGPSSALWTLGRMVAASPALTEVFDGGVRGVVARLDARRAEPDVGAFLDALDAFVAEHGHRGPDEFELASDTWGTNPEIALGAVERLRLSPASADPTAANQRLAIERAELTARAVKGLPRPLRALFRRMLATAITGAAGRERAKGTLVRGLYGTRLALHELARRLVERGAVEDPFAMFMVTIDELRELIVDPAPLRAVIAERRARYEELNALVPPFVFEGRIPDPSTWARRGVDTAQAASAGDTLTGMGVSGGSAKGRARVVRDPADPRGIEPGDVLVAPITDPSWTPLFLTATAVVVEVGAMQSHAAIVARELGIPAVVSVSGCMSRIADGALLEVDADRGTVRIVEV